MELPVVTVRGEAFREVAPEVASFSVTASARDKDRETTLQRLRERAAAVGAVLDRVATEKRETGHLQVHPELKRGGERVSAYAGSVTTNVTVTDFEVLGELMLRLAEIDQTSVAGPWWQLRPDSTAGAEVRTAAIRNALRKAHEYAEAVGSEVHGLIEIADDGVGGGAQPVMMRAMTAAAYDTGAPDLDVEPQAQTVSAAVVVRVSISEPRDL
jgi:uncharacterized protein YggE